MSSNITQRQKKIEKVIKACDSIIDELRGTPIANEEFLQLSDRLNKLMKVVYQQRSQRSQAATTAFTKAMVTLQRIRMVK